MTVLRPVYPAEPPALAEIVKAWLEKEGFELQPENAGAAVGDRYAKGMWVTKHPNWADRVVIRYRGNGSREDVERALMPVAEKLDALGVMWEWVIPDGRYAALGVGRDPRLQ